jgi:transmembrane sensor
MPNQERLNYLFQRYLDRTETPEELEELMEIIETDDQKTAVEQALETAHTGVDRSVRLTNEQSERLYATIMPQSDSAQIIPMNPSRKWGRIAVAAAVLAALSVGGYLFFFNGNNKPAGEVTAVQPAVNDVPAPQATRATITLANGRTVALDSITALAQDNVQLTKTPDGRLVYSGAANAIAYNTLTNPRGSQVIDITLADGSKVWLNAGSSITYPVAFVGNERKVEMNGEAYFEVAHNKTKPFYVSKGAMQVQVLGTHFNVNAYDDDKETKVTLLQGSVKVGNGQSAKDNKTAVVLKPGQQAVLSRAHSPLTIHHSPDLDQVMAWKNGLFEFNETDIQTVMKQLERWYDVQVVFDGAFTQHFNGTIKRQVNVSKVLNMLEKTGGLRFSIEGKKVIVKKY